jgi:hypothetical protein
MSAPKTPRPLAVIDAVVADMRASGDTGHVENLLLARADIAELIEADRGYDNARSGIESTPYEVKLTSARRAAALATITGATL